MTVTHDDDETSAETTAFLTTLGVDDIPNSEEEHQEAWNEPRVNIVRFAAMNLSFLVTGMTRSAIGALLPYILTYYGISYSRVSTIFVVPVLGSLASAMINNTIHHTFGQRGIAFLAPFSRLLVHVTLAFHPPFPVLPVILIMMGFGDGLDGGAWDAWVGNMRNSNELLGLLHGAFGLGGIIAPLIASMMVAKLNLSWYAFYYVMIVLSLIEMTTAVSAFWTANSDAYRSRLQFMTSRKSAASREIVSSPVPWIAASFLFACVGVEFSLGGWITTFMLKVRHADGLVAGLSTTLFWSGLTLGRVVLGFVTGRVGEKLAITIYLVLCILLQLVYWLIPELVVSVMSVTLLGFFLGPLLPALVVTVTKLLPVHQHVSAIVLASSLGSGSAALLPFLAGFMAEKYGVQVLQPFVLILLMFSVFLWLLFPGGFRKGGLERARDRGVTFFRGLKSVLGVESSGE